MRVKHKILQYRGSSMIGTFRPGDLLVVREIALKDARPGDVVAFRAPGRDATDLIVHRVVTGVDNELITRGDACGAPDTDHVQADGLVGRVIHAQRGRHVRRVWGGWIGRWWARALRLRGRVLTWGRLPYRWLRASGVMRRLWRPAITHVTLSTGQGSVVKYLYHGKTVATWRPERQSYRCRKPYDLVLDAPLPATSVCE